LLSFFTRISYLFLPLNLLTSLAKSTVVFNNLAVLLALDGALQSVFSPDKTSFYLFE
jgi:hypothetical protein